MKQDTRFLRMNTPLGPERLTVTGLSGEEALSVPFSFGVEAFSQDSPVDMVQLIGRPAVVSMRSGRSDDRHFHGYIATATYLGMEFATRRYRYRMVLVPWLWFLSKRADCRIFQNKTVPQIAEEIFKELGFSDYKLQLIGTAKPRPYCVQYRETDLDFLSRLFEEEGIFYFFTHEKDRHVLVLGDTPAAHPPLPGNATLEVKRADTVDARPGIIHMSENIEVRSGRVALSDHNFETPKADLSTTATTVQSQPFNAHLEQFDYPGGHADRGEGDRRAKLRMERAEATYRTYEGRSNVTRMACGTAMQVTRHEIRDYNRSYTLLSVTHQATNDLDGNGAGYSNSFAAIPNDTPYRPPARSRKTLVEGPQTATVVGPRGEEIHTDKYGRIKVSFHWDRRSKADEASSCWVRVGQSLAGARWGGIFIPRVGMEVIVEFLEGDPDCPIVTGCVYNADAMPPYPLPGNRTRGLIKTRSSPKASGFNELRFEDKAGAEHIFIHAQRDLDLRVQSRRRALVGGIDHLTVGGDRRAEVKGADNLTIARDMKTKIGAALSLDVATDIDQKAGTSIAVKAGMQLVLEAGSLLSLKVGGSFITLGPSGVAISGPTVLINSGGSAGSLSASPDAPDKPEAPPTAEGGSDGTANPRRLQRPTGGRERIAQIEALQGASKSGAAFCEMCARSGQ